MGMDLAEKNFKLDPENFWAGVNIPVAKAVKTAGEAIAAHAPVILNSAGKLVNVNATTTGSGESKTTTVNVEGLYGIAAEDAAADEPVVVYLTGEVFSTALALKKDVTAAHVEIPLRNLGIFLK